MEKWNSWIQQKERPLLHLTPSDRIILEGYDEKLGQFLGTEEKILRYHEVQRHHRLWLHRRAEQLGLSSKSYSYDDSDGPKGTKMVQMVKPSGWQMRWE